MIHDEQEFIYEELKAMGLIALENDDPEQALGLFEQALDLEPTNPEAFINIGRSYTAMGKYKKAKPFFEKALEYDENTWRALYWLAQYYFSYTELLKTAEEYAFRALKVFPDKASTHTLLGRICQRKKQFNDAENYFKQALVLDDNEHLARLNYSFLLAKQKKWDEAFQLIQPIFTEVEGKKKTYYYLCLGKILYEKSLVEPSSQLKLELIDALEKALLLSEEGTAFILEHQYYCHKALGDVYRSLREYNRAKKHYSWCVDNCLERDHENLALLAGCEVFIGDLKASDMYFKKYIKTSETPDVEMIFMFAYSLYEKKEYKEAILYIDSIYSELSGQALKAADSNLYKAYMALGHTQKANQYKVSN